MEEGVISSAVTRTPMPDGPFFSVPEVYKAIGGTGS